MDCSWLAVSLPRLPRSRKPRKVFRPTPELEPSLTVRALRRAGCATRLPHRTDNQRCERVDPGTSFRDPDMADISITPLAARTYRVEVRDGHRETTHQVTVPERLGERFQLGEDDLERVVRESFRFLEREPATSILRQFSLSDISRFFPEYPSELARRLS
jgi:hypothetical protein